MTLLHRLEKVDGLPVEKPEISRVRGDGRRGESVDEAVERARGPGLEPAGVLGLLPDRVHDLGARPPAREHLPDQRGRMLQVRVESDHDVPGREIQPRRQRRLMAEVSGEADRGDGRIARPEALDDAHGAVRRAVIDENDLVADVEAFQNGRELGIEGAETTLLVENGHDDRKQGGHSRRYSRKNRARHGDWRIW